MINSDKQFESRKIEVKCPECEHDFTKEVEITIYKLDVDFDIE